MNSPTPLSQAIHVALDAGPRSNPALDRLVRDDHVYHLVFLGLGGAACATLGYSAVRLLRERRLGGAALLIAVTLLIALVWAGNLTTVLGPRHAVAEAASSLSSPHPGTHLARVDDAYASWLTAGHGAMPTVVRHAVDDRIAWQAPKTIVCAALLVLAGLITRRLWSTRAGSAGVGGLGELRPWHVPRRGRVARQLAALLACLVLAAMVIGNAESWAGPVFPTVLYG